MLSLGKTHARRWLAAFGILWLVLPACAAAQEDAPAYRDKLVACNAAGDYECGFDAMMEYGYASAPMPQVAVSVAGGATVFGIQMFTVLDSARDSLPPETVLGMTNRAVAYVYDSQPELSYASGPFLLLHGETCRELDDKNCTSQAAFALQLMLEAGQWYLPSVGDGAGPRNLLARAEAFVNDTLEAN